MPSAISSARGSMPATAGMSRDRARIETCDDAPPAWVQKPTTFVRSSEAVSDGVRSSATRIVPSGMSVFSRRCAGHLLQDALADVAHVRRALGEQLVLQLGEALRVGV